MYTSSTQSIVKAFAIVLCSFALFTQSTYAQQHTLPKPKRVSLQPGTVMPNHAHTHNLQSQGHGNLKSLITTDMLDYNTYSELMAEALQIAYVGSLNTSTPQIYATELTSFVTDASANNNDATFAQVAFDSLAFASYANSTFYHLPRAGSVVTLDSIGIFMGIWGDTVSADGKMAHDSLVISIYRIPANQSVPSATPVTTIVNAGYAGLQNFFTSDQALKPVIIPAAQTFNAGESFAIKVTYLNKDTSSHCDIAYGYMDSCQTIVYQGTTYASPAYTPVFPGSSSMGAIMTYGNGLDSIELQSNDYSYYLQDFTSNCMHVYQQNWQIMPFVSVQTPYMVQIQAATTIACNGTSIPLDGLVFGTDSTNINYTWAVNGGGTLASSNTASTTLTIPSNVYNNVTVTFTANDGSGNVSDSLVITNCHVNVSLGANQSLCTGSSVELNAVTTSGTAPYTYQWSATNGSFSCTNCSNPIVTLSQNTVYTVTVTDAAQSSMSASVSYTTNGTTNTMTAALFSTYIYCNNGVDTTTVTISGGTAPYTVIWDNTGNSTTNGGTSQTFNYSQAGLKTVMVVDANFCTTALTDTVIGTGPSISLVQSTPVTCSNSNTGQLIVSVSGGTPPYAYNWPVNGSITNTLSNVPAGTYEVIITDANGCSVDGYYTVNGSGYNGFYVYTNVTNPNCAQSGSINAIASGGVGTYTYLWSDTETTATILVNTTADYAVTVTDSLGCQAYGYAYVQSSCVGNITGYVFNDSTGNCTLTGNPPIANMFITATSVTSGNIYYGFSDVNGYYDIQVTEAGTFNLTAQNNYSGLCGNISFCGNSNQTVTLSSITDSSNNNNIGFTVTPNSFNLGIHPGWTSANPGFSKQYWVYYYNSSPTPYNGPAVITFVYDSNLIYTGTDMQPAPVNNTATHTLTWNVSSVPSLFINNNINWNQLDAYFQVPAQLSLNYQLQSTFTITPIIGDCDNTDNIYTYSETVIGSHDPNEKTVSPAGPVTEADSVLTYTIHFQNTGTDSTHFVVIKDTLSPNLDASTVRNIASSDKYSSFTVTGKGILTWVFNPLKIVDSATNPAGSKRFVMFSIKKKANLAIGTTISNTASIYFDYNDAVVTNTVTDTAALPTIITPISPNSSINITAFPNPFNDVTHIVVNGLTDKFSFELYDVTGRLQQNIPSLNTNQFDLHRGQLSNGVYLYRIIVTGKPAAYGKLVVE